MDKTPEEGGSDVKLEVTPLPRRSPRLRRSAPVSLNNVQVCNEILMGYAGLFIIVEMLSPLRSDSKCFISKLF